ncbi:YheE [Bacillus sp. B14905]|nr:YheE [Bacillus sp. B14905]
MMIQHFSFKSLFENTQLPGWTVSFFYQRERYSAEYLKDGTIQWTGPTPPNEEDVKKMIHELMLFHVYD